MNGSGQASSFLSISLGVVIVVGVLRYAQDVFMPLALSILLTFLLAPLVERLQHWKFNRVIAVAVSVSLAFGLIGAIAYVVLDQFVDLVNQLPRYRQQLRTNLMSLSGVLQDGVSETMRAVDQLTRELNRVAPAVVEPMGVRKVEIVPPAKNAFHAVTSMIGPLIKPVGTSAIVIVFVIFMLLKLPDLRDRVIRLLGSRNLRVTTEALDDAAKRVSRYLLMQTLINLWQGTLVTLGLHFLGLPNAMLWGALTMALRFIPYVGPWVAASMPVALSFAVFDSWTQPLLVVGWFIVLELVSNMVLEPWLYGSRTGVSPVALLVAAVFWTWLWGTVGLFLAIPLTVCLVVMGKYMPQLEFLQVLLGDQPVLEPQERLYQRLLASNRDEADDLLEDALRTTSLLEVCDRIIVPAMQLAEDDHDRGAMKNTKRQQVLAHINHWADELIDSRKHANARKAEPVSTDAADAGAKTFTPYVYCIPAGDQADEITAKLLVAVLLEHGITASTTRAADLSECPSSVIVVSALPPDAVTPARAVCRRLRATLGPSPLVLVGLWHATGDSLKAWQRLESAGASRMLTSFAVCLSQLSGHMESRRPGPAALEPVGAPAARA